jgi:hypothetical protein
MNEFLPLDHADILISDLTGESLRAGRARELTRFGTLKSYILYRGCVGLFLRNDVINNSISTAALFPVPKDKCYFVGVLQSVVAPSLDGAMERIVGLPGTDKLISKWSTVDELKPREVLLAFMQHMDPAMPAQPPKGFYWGRVLSEFRHGSQVIQPAMLDSSPVPESTKRVSSDEIWALFEKAKTGTVAPDQAAATVSAVLNSDAMSDPMRRLALLRTLGGTAKYSKSEWTFTGIKALVVAEKADGRMRCTEKTIRADLKKAAQAERDATRAGAFDGLGQR